MIGGSEESEGDPVLEGKEVLFGGWGPATGSSMGRPPSDCNKSLMDVESGGRGSEAGITSFIGLGGIFSKLLYSKSGIMRLASGGCKEAIVA